MVREKLRGGDLQAVFAPLVDLVYPVRCPLCGAAIFGPAGLCGDCWGLLAIPGSPACAACHRPLACSGAMDGNGGGGELCGGCLADLPRHHGLFAGVLYNDASRRLVLGLKRGRRLALAALMARLIAARVAAAGAGSLGAGSLGAAGGWLAVPVPLHRWRLWQRGFNQSALIARELAPLVGARVLVDGLVRQKATPPLGPLGEAERRAVLHGAIVPNRAHLARLRGAQVMLVDDVYTSGATTDACLAALEQAGAARVQIACFARVLNDA